jgi:site-specific DNA recombinase
MSQAVIENKPKAVLPDEGATAVIYLRVSSDGQVNKAHNPEGYSIPSQRDACIRHATRLGAEVIAEFVELGRSGTNLRRPELQNLLAALPTLRPTYVIFYDLSRVAREEQDAFWLLGEIRRHGAKLESTLERIDDSPQGLLLFAIMAGVNAFRSRGDGEKVRMGLQRKFSDGGAISKAPIGYMNTRERIEGREVRVVAIDPDRAPLVQMAFEAYATGDFSLSDIREILEEAGLRSRRTAKLAPSPLSRSQVHRMLSDDFYIGVVTWDGAKNPEGRHDPLIDPETFAKVQEVMASAMLSGNRTRKHKHYLRGSMFCGYCGRLMVFSRVRGKTGATYEYFGCLSHQGRRTRQCGARHILVSNVERAVEQFYASVRLTSREQQAVRKALRAYTEEQIHTAQRECDRHNRRLQELQRQQQKLLHAFYNGNVAEEVLAAEQRRIDAERAEARRWATAATHDAAEIKEALDEALKLLTDPHIRYREADPETRRLLNHALFEKLYIRDHDVSEAKPSPWVTDLHRVARTPKGQPHKAQGCQQGHRKAHGPISGAVGFHKDQMVRAKGLEPPRASAHRLLRPACLPIPPRPRGSSAYSGRPVSRAREPHEQVS